MLGILVYLLIVLMVIGVVWWLIDYLPVPQPLNHVAKIILVVVGMVALIYVLLSLTGGAPSVGLPKP